MLKTIVAYYADTDDTTKIAERIADATEGDLLEIKPAQPYTAADLDWSGEDSRSFMETADESARPEIILGNEDLAAYELVFLGFPIWGYVEPRFIDTFLEAYDFAGKRIVPFSTSEGIRLDEAAERIRTLCPEADVRAGRRLSATDSDATLIQWLAPLTR